MDNDESGNKEWWLQAKSKRIKTVKPANISTNDKKKRRVIFRKA